MAKPVDQVKKLTTDVSQSENVTASAAESGHAYCNHHHHYQDLFWSSYTFSYTLLAEKGKLKP